MNAGLRFTIFIVLHILLCLSVYQYAGAYMDSRSTAEAVESMYVDGTDFTAIANLGVDAFNGVISLVTGLSGIVVMAVVSAVLLIPFRFLALKKSAWITGLEAGGTLAVIFGGVALSMFVGSLCKGMAVLFWMGMMFVPVLLFEILLYWLGLLMRKR